MAGSMPPPIEYSAGESRRPLATRYHLLISLISAGMFLAVALPLWVIIPRFENIYKDFKVELPGITKLVLSISRFCVNGPGAILSVVMCLAIVAGGLLVDSRSQTDASIRRYAWITILVSLLLLVVWAGVTVFALFAPIISLFESVSGPTSR